MAHLALLQVHTLLVHTSWGSQLVVPQASMPPQPLLIMPHWPGWHVAGVQHMPM
jgi:hypothetical protein